MRRVVLAAGQDPKDDAEVDVDHVGAGGIEHIHDGGRAVLDEPIEDAPLGSSLGAVPAVPVRLTADGDDHELAMVEVLVPKDDVLKNLAHCAHSIYFLMRIRSVRRPSPSLVDEFGPVIFF